MEGLEGEARQNVELALSPPEGILNKDQVNEPLLALFLKEIPQKVREALEPFGYYHARVETSTERPTDRLLLHVKVDPGPPVRVAFLKFDLQGPGAEDEKLKEALPQFPLKENDILRQDFYEEGKKGLQDAARELGYLAADFSTHVIQLSLAENSANLRAHPGNRTPLLFRGGHFRPALDLPGILPAPVPGLSARKALFAPKTGSDAIKFQ